MAKFLQLVMYPGPFPADYLDQPDADPAQFGLPTEDDSSRDDPLLAPSRWGLRSGSSSGDSRRAVSKACWTSPWPARRTWMLPRTSRGGSGGGPGGGAGQVVEVDALGVRQAQGPGESGEQ
jgi:hypothetical protein